MSGSPWHIESMKGLGYGREHGHLSKGWTGLMRNRKFQPMGLQNGYLCPEEGNHTSDLADERYWVTSRSGDLEEHISLVLNESPLCPSPGPPWH